MRENSGPWGRSAAVRELFGSRSGSLGDRSGVVWESFGGRLESFGVVRGVFGGRSEVVRQSFVDRSKNFQKNVDFFRFFSPIRFPLVGPKGVLSSLAVGSSGPPRRVPPSPSAGSPPIVKFPKKVEK